jgi:hypothetical protein
MIARFTHRISLVFACLLVFALTSLSTQALAQKGLWNKTKEGVQKGAEGVKQGAETVGEKTKEGVQTTGREVKKAVTGEDDTNSINREKPTEVRPQEPATRPYESVTKPSGPATTKPSGTAASMGKSSTTTHPSKSSRKELPRTAGELSLLELTGALAFAGAGLSKLLRGIVKF